MEEDFSILQALYEVPSPTPPPRLFIGDAREASEHARATGQQVYRIHPCCSNSELECFMVVSSPFLYAKTDDPTVPDKVRYLRLELMEETA